MGVYEKFHQGVAISLKVMLADGCSTSLFLILLCTIARDLLTRSSKIRLRGRWSNSIDAIPMSKALFVLVGYTSAGFLAGVWLRRLGQVTRHERGQVVTVEGTWLNDPTSGEAVWVGEHGIRASTTQVKTIVSESNFAIAPSLTVLVFKTSTVSVAVLISTISYTSMSWLALLTAWIIYEPFFTLTAFRPSVREMARTLAFGLITLFHTLLITGTLAGAYSILPLIFLLVHNSYT